MVHSEVYLNKDVVTVLYICLPWLLSKYNINIKTALFACFRFLIFHPFFQGSTDPICPYVRTPMHRKHITPLLLGRYCNVSLLVKDPNKVSHPLLPIC